MVFCEAHSARRQHRGQGISPASGVLTSKCDACVNLAAPAARSPAPSGPAPSSRIIELMVDKAQSPKRKPTANQIQVLLNYVIFRGLREPPRMPEKDRQGVTQNPQPLQHDSLLEQKPSSGSNRSGLARTPSVCLTIMGMFCPENCHFSSTSR